MIDVNSVAEKSNFYEQMIEHVFLSEVLQETWFRYKTVVEILRAEIDSSGYDVVLECNEVIRHVQLKTSITNARKTIIKANTGLCTKPSGCIIWIEWELNESKRVTFNYLLFGSKPGEPLPDIYGHKIAKHVKADSQGIKKERPSMREIKKTEFKKIKDIGELIEVLFGLQRD